MNQDKASLDSRFDGLVRRFRAHRKAGDYLMGKQSAEMAFALCLLGRSVYRPCEMVLLMRNVVKTDTGDVVESTLSHCVARVGGAMIDAHGDDADVRWMNRFESIACDPGYRVEFEPIHIPVCSPRPFLTAHKVTVKCAKHGVQFTYYGAERIYNNLKAHLLKRPSSVDSDVKKMAS